MKRTISISFLCLLALALAWKISPAARAQKPADTLAAAEALKQGRDLLKRGQSDQALAKLQPRR